MLSCPACKHGTLTVIPVMVHEVRPGTVHDATRRTQAIGCNACEVIVDMRTSAGVLKSVAALTLELVELAES